MITQDDVTWTWFIRKVNLKKNEHDLKNVITSIQWTLEAEYIDSDKDHHVKCYSASTELLTATDISNFVDYDDIVKDTIISWIVSTEGEEKISSHKEKLIKRLNEDLGNEVTRVINFD